MAARLVAVVVRYEDPREVAAYVSHALFTLLVSCIYILSQMLIYIIISYIITIYFVSGIGENL
jgi:hypothetical protein